MSETLTMGDFTAQLNGNEAKELRERFAEGGPGFHDGPTRYTSLVAALAAVQAELPQVVKAETANIPGKEGKSGYKYSYADLAAVTRAILPRLGAYGLSWVTMPTLLDGRFVLVYRLMHASGGSVEGVYPLPDRGSPQDIGSAITYARRYCLCSVTGVAPDDDDDAAEATANHGRNAMTTPPMSQFERKTGLALLRPPTAEERKAPDTLLWASFVQALDFQACLNEKGLWSTPSDGEDSPTWGELYTSRVAAEIAAVNSADAGGRLYSELKSRNLDMKWQGKAFSVLLRERAAAVKQENEQRTSDLTEAVLNATNASDLGAARSRIEGARHLVTETQLTALRGVVSDRAEKLGVTL